MRLTTFNLRYGTADDGPDQWQHRKEQVIETIETLAPDIMGVQECLPFQGDEIAMRIPSLTRFGLGRYHNTKTAQRPHEHLSGEHCDIFYDPRKLRLVQGGTFWHSATPDVPGSECWGNGMPRITTWGKFEPYDASAPFVLFNTHFHWTEPYVSNAAELVLKRMAEIAGGTRIILSGDFNAAPGSPLHTLLTGRGTLPFQLHDAWITLGQSEKNAGTSHSFSGVPEKRIDWVLCSAGFTPRSIEKHTLNKNGRYPSDHFPVSVEME